MANSLDDGDEIGTRRAADAPSTIAHRGFAYAYPENTLGAFREAVTVDPGLETLEIDVRQSADGELFVFHDDTLGRLTDAPADVRDRPVWELPFETIRSFDVLGTDERVPRLSEVLEAVPSDVRLNVEFKNPGRGDVRFAENLPSSAREAARDRWLEFAGRVVDVLAEYPHEVLVSSFFEGAIAAMRDVDPTVPVAWIFYESVADGFEVAGRYDCEAIHPPLSMLSGTTLFNEEYTGREPYEEVDVLAIADDEGREVNAWTVDTWHQAAELRRIGVDGMLVDYPRLLEYGTADSGRVATAHGRRPPSQASK